MVAKQRNCCGHRSLLNCKRGDCFLTTIQRSRNGEHRTKWFYVFVPHEWCELLTALRLSDGGPAGSAKCLSCGVSDLYSCVVWWIHSCQAFYDYSSRICIKGLSAWIQTRISRTRVWSLTAALTGCWLTLSPLLLFPCVLTCHYCY
jgi:hypothetical protein